MPVNPMLDMISPHQDTVLVPFICGKFLHWHLANDPGTTHFIDYHLFTGVR